MVNLKPTGHWRDVADTSEAGAAEGVVSQVDCADKEFGHAGSAIDFIGSSPVCLGATRPETLHKVSNYTPYRISVQNRMARNKKMQIRNGVMRLLFTNNPG
jgi:hypothetical protein